MFNNNIGNIPFFIFIFQLHEYLCTLTVLLCYNIPWKRKIEKYVILYSQGMLRTDGILESYYVLDTFPFCKEFE